MSIVEESKRVKDGQLLIDMENQAINAATALNSVKANIETLKAKMVAGDEYTEEDVQEAQDVLDKVGAELTK